VALSSPSERSLKRWNLLSSVPPLMGFECFPPAGIPPCVHSQKPKLPSDRRSHAPVHVPPSWFRATSMVFSATKLRVCCTPQPAKGSLRFMRATGPHRPKTARPDRNNSRNAVHTLRRLSLASSRTASLRPLPSCRYRPAWRRIRSRPETLPTTPRRSVSRTPAITLRVTDSPRPERRGNRFPAPDEMGCPVVRRVLDSLSPWGGGPDAPKSSGFPVP
jgi:hypothetical protein